jgi:sulfite reductase (NADPH) flavoprotein alpha-component
MLRQIHRWPGLLAAALILALALSGAALSLFPALERLSSPAAISSQTVGDLAAKVLAAHPGVEQIRRSPSGRITAYWFEGDVAGAAVVDPATGQDVASADQGAVQRWLTDFHRSLLLGDAGRYGSAVGAVAMLLLALSGAGAGGAAVKAVGQRWFQRRCKRAKGRTLACRTGAGRGGRRLVSDCADRAVDDCASTFDLLPDG